MKAVYYFDMEGREILQLSLVFVVINYARKGTEVILDPNKLKTRFKGLKRSKKSLEKATFIDINQEDIDAIIELCYQHKITEAEDYCINLFDEVANKEFGIENLPRRYR